MSNVTQTKIVCLDCNQAIEGLAKLELGDIVECPNCGTEMEIMSLEPLKY